MFAVDGEKGDSNDVFSVDHDGKMLFVCFGSNMPFFLGAAAIKKKVWISLYYFLILV